MIKKIKEVPIKWRIKIKFICLFVYLLLQGSMLFSQEQKLNISDNRAIDSIEVESNSESIEPILIEETLPNEVGEWDLRFNFDFSKNEEDIITTLPQVQLFFGIFKNIGGEISLPFIYRKEEVSEYGLGSISTSLKWLVLRQSRIIPAIVLGFEVGFPTNSFAEESEERSFEYSPYIAFLKDFGKLSIQGNIGLATEIPVAGGEKNLETKLNVAFAHPYFDGKLDVIAELHSSWSKNEENELYASPGLRYYVNSKHSLAFAVPVNLNNSSVLRMIFQYQFQF